MQRSVRVDDYFENDDNGVWSWYLTNIRNGDFEEFNKNKLKNTLLKRFLNEYFDPSHNYHHQSNTKILFVSIPDKVHHDLPLLENFLRDYFNLEHLEHIQITKLTQAKVYNHENHYILIDTMNNFEDPSFLRIVNSRWPQHDTRGKEKTTPEREVIGNNYNDDFVNEMSESDASGTKKNTQRYNTNDNGNDNIKDKNKDEDKYNYNKKDSNNNNNKQMNNIGSHGHYDKAFEVNSTNDDPARHKDNNKPFRINHRDANMYGTISEHHDSSSNSLSSIPSYPGMLVGSHSNSRSSNIPSQRVEVKSILSESVNENNDDSSDRFFNDIDDVAGPKRDSSPDGSDDNDDSIVLNFSHSALREQLKGSTSQRLMEQQQRANNLYSPTQSETVSINSFDEESKDENDSECGDEATDYSGQPLTLTVTRNEDIPESPYYSSQEEDGISELSSVSRSLQSLGSTTSLEDNEVDDDSSDYSILSILPSISISDSLGHFRLVLQSSLLQNPDTKEVYTAIRQSNNEPTVADVEDDWLLYDSKFSMNNLQMLTLQDLLDMNRSFPKIIFYSMVMLSDMEKSSRDSENQENINNLVAPSQSTLLKYSVDNDQLSGMGSDISSSNEPKQFFPTSDDEDLDYDDASLSEKSDPRMYAPTRIQSNATTAHRSIRTVNSIGDWAFLHDGNETSRTTDLDTDLHQTESNVHFGKDPNALHLSSSHTRSKNGLSKVSTVASMGPVERSKSTPLPVILKSLSIDNEGKRWRAKMDSFRRKRIHKHQNGQKNCTIM